MSRLEQMNAVVKHVWTEPKFVAQVKWRALQPSLSQQLEAQVGRSAMERFAAGGGWPEPDRVVSFVLPDEEPDWDWWEPRHDQLWRREAARARELEGLLNAS